MGGIDALVFTAGVGEHAAEVRATICTGLDCLGLALDSARNTAKPSDQDIATAESKVRVLVVRAQEDWAIARECWKLLTHEQ